MGFLLLLVGEYGLEQTLKNKERKRTPSSPTQTCQPLSSGTEQNSFLSSTSHQWKVWVVLKGLAFQAWKKKGGGTNHNSMVFQRQLLSTGLFCAVNTEFYQFEPIFFSLGCSCICIWSSGFCDCSRQGSALPHPAVCWRWPWRYGRYGRYGSVCRWIPVEVEGT